MTTMGTVARHKTLRAIASGQLERGPCEKCGRARVLREALTALRRCDGCP